MIAGRRKSSAIAAALVVAALMLSACSSPPTQAKPGPHPVTTEEAQLLAIARFNNFDAGSRPFSTVASVSNAELTIRGWVDYGSHLGYASVTGNFDPQTLLWTTTTVGTITQSPDTTGFPRLPIPPLSSQEWQSRPIDATTSDLDTILAIIGNLGQDRPDNPLLVQQSGALWLRTDSVDGTAVTVFAAPLSDKPVTGSATPDANDSPLRLWVNASGLILRAELKRGSGWTTIDFPDDPAPRLKLPKASDG